MKRVLSLVVLILLCIHMNAQGQAITTPNFRLFGARDGLPSAQVTTLIQDSRGYIWVGTKQGIARFNGLEFHAFKYQDGLPNGFINKIREDEQKRIWALCSNGLVCINGDKLEGFSQSNLYLQDFIIEANDTIRFFGNLNRDDRQVTGYFLHGKYFIEKEFNGFYINSIVRDASSGQSYLLYNSEIWTVEKTPRRICRLPYEIVSKHFNHKLIELENQIYLISTSGDEYRIHLFEDDHFTLTAHYTGGKWTLPLPQPIASKLCHIFNSEHGVIAGQKYELGNFGDQTITSAIVGRDGTLWLGSEQGLIRHNTNAFTHFDVRLLPEVWGVTQDTHGKIWTCSYTQGIRTIQNGKIEHVKLSNEKRFYYLHPSHNGKDVLYFPHDIGITKRNPDGSTKELVDKNTPKYCLYTHYDSQSETLWGGFRGEVIIWDKNDRVIRTISHYGKEKITNNILCIARDSVGDFWLGGRRIFRYIWEKDSLIEYKIPTPNITCHHMATDPSGRVWLATSKGVYYHDKSKDKILRVPSEELKDISNIVYPIDEKHLLTSQANGLYIIDLDEFNRSEKVNFTYYSECNGYFSEFPEQAGIFKDRDGNYWITSSTSLSCLDPKKLRYDESFDFNIVFQSYNNTPISYESQEVRLPFNQNSATVVFDGVTFCRSREIGYKYRIGKSNTYSDIQKKNYIVLTDLRQGRTTLYIRPYYIGANIPISESEYSIDIYVNQAFYKQKWFLPVAITLLLLVVITLIRVQRRTKIQLEQTLMRVRISEIETIEAQLNPHFVYNILTSVQSKIRKSQMDKAEDLLLKLSHLIRGFLHTSVKSTNSNGEEAQSQVSFTSLADELTLLQEFIDFQQELFPSTFIYDLSIGNGIDISTTKIPSMLLQPLVENAISHGLIPKGSIGMLRLSIKKDLSTDNLIITIADNGIGMEQSRKLKEASKLKYNSYGRKLSTRRIQLLNDLGYHIETTTDSSINGTSVILIFDKHTYKNQ